MIDLHNLDAEIAVLGTALYDNASIYPVIDHIKPEHFFDPIHGELFDRIVGQVNAGKISDAVTLKQEFDAEERLKEIGGAGYLAHLIGMAVPVEAAVEYAKIIRELSDKRSCQSIANDLVAMLDENTAQEAILAAESSLADVMGIETLAETATGAEALRQAIRQANDTSHRFPTGFRDVDRKLGGLRRGKIYILAGRSSMGKTALAVAMAWQIALEGAEVAFVSAEMPASEIGARLGAGISSVPYRRLLDGDMDDEQTALMETAISALEDRPLTIFDTPGLSVPDLRALLRRWQFDVRKRGGTPGPVFVDYMQLLRQPTGRTAYEKASETARELQAMARSLQVPLVALSQLSRASESESDKRPAIRHLRDSGAIEEVADAILLIYRDAYYAEREPPNKDMEKEAERKHRAGSRKVEIDIAKHRQGAIGKIQLVGDLPVNSFEEWG